MLLASKLPWNPSHNKNCFVIARVHENSYLSPRKVLQRPPHLSFYCKKNSSPTAATPPTCIGFKVKHARVTRRAVTHVSCVLLDGYNAFQYDHAKFCLTSRQTTVSHWPLSAEALRSRDHVHGFQHAHSPGRLRHSVQLVLTASDDGDSSGDMSPHTGSRPRPHTDSIMQEYTKPIEILPYLFLGNEFVSRQHHLLESCGIDHVFVVGKECEAPSEDMLQHYKYYRIDLHDDDEQNLTPFFEDAYNIIGMEANTRMFCTHRSHIHPISDRICTENWVPCANTLYCGTFQICLTCTNVCHEEI